MSKLIDIAEECGAEKHVTFNKNGIHETGKILIKPDQLRATVEQVAGPLVELIRNQALVESIMGIEGKAKQAIAAYTEIMGEKK